MVIGEYGGDVKIKKKVKKNEGGNDDVMIGQEQEMQTTGELKKKDLEINKHGKIVSKIKLITSTLTNNFVNKRVE